MYPRDTLMRIVVLSLLVYALVSLGAVTAELRSVREGNRDLSDELRRLETENAELRQELSEGTDREAMLRRARERLGLVLPGEKVFYFITDREV